MNELLNYLVKEKYKKHFCKGEKVFKPICKECKEEEANFK